MADEEWGEYKKEDWVEEVGETKMAAVLIVHFPSCPRSLASRPTDHFLYNLSLYSSVQVYMAMYAYVQPRP